MTGLGPAVGGKYLTFSVTASDFSLGTDCGRRSRRSRGANSSSRAAHCAVCDEPIRMHWPCSSHAQCVPRLQDWATADAAAEHQLAVVAARGPASAEIGAGSAQVMHAVLCRRQDHVALRDTIVCIRQCHHVALCNCVGRRAAVSACSCSFSAARRHRGS